MPKYSKNQSNDFFSRINELIWLIFCKKHMGDLSILNSQNCFSHMINRPKVGGVNLENDVKFQMHGPFELGS